MFAANLFRGAAPVASSVWTDDFNRSDASTLGSAWTARLNTMGIESNNARVTFNGAGMASNNAAMPSNDQQTDMILGANVSLGNNVVIGLGYNTSGQGLYVNIANGQPPNFFRMAVWSDFDFTTGLISGSGGSAAAWTAGDKASLKRVGNVYTALKNDVPLAVWTDSSNTVPRDVNHRLTAIGGSASGGFYRRIDSASALTP